MVVNLSTRTNVAVLPLAGSDAIIVYTPALYPFLEEFLTLIAPDEMLEVTPLHLRLRKQKFQA